MEIWETDGEKSEALNAENPLSCQSGVLNELSANILYVQRNVLSTCSDRDTNESG